jgi:DNA-binding CsgD family transcriptional regulator
MQLSSLFYGYLLLFYLWALFHRRSIVTVRWRRAMTVFIAGAVLWHLLWAFELSFFQLQLSEKGPLPSILLTNALWEIFWAAVMLVPSVAEIAQQARGAADYSVPDEFIREYGISRREAEVIPKLCAGESSKSIADTLYISPRTVENHIQNIYRKCGVGRRLELVNLLNRYSG